MTRITDENIRHEATRFRYLIERLDKSIFTQFLHFPRNCCDTACVLLNFWLYQRGLELLPRIRGKRPDIKGFHVWLQRADLVIDITADQFSVKQPKVIVSRLSTWHEGFLELHRFNATSRHEEETRRLYYDSFHEICDAAPEILMN